MDIKQIQTRLNTLGYTPRLVVDGVSGSATKNAILWFQKRNGLTPDGIVGPKTIAKLLPEGTTTSTSSNFDLKPLPTTLSRDLKISAMQIALSQFNVREKTGRNDGAAVETYLKSTGLGKGYSWCMAFVYWCYQNAADKLNVKNPLKKTAGVLDQWHSSPKDWQIWASSKNKPMVGDIFIMDFGKGQGHTGIVTKVLADGSVETIEGNANSYGSREGNQVGKLTRKGLKYFIRVK